MASPRGVGFGCHLGLPEALYASCLLDFVEVSPELFHREERSANGVRLVPDDRLYEPARRRCGQLPMVVHGVLLSIGSAHGLFEPCLDMMDCLQRDWPFHWYSEHLQFQTTIGIDGEVINTGIPFPLPPTNEAAELVAGRADMIQQRFAVPFLLENPVHYLPDLPADPDICDEFGLMQRILSSSACGQLLDLHNLHCNATNFGFDARAALDRIRLDRVQEIHIAGGSWRDGFYTDAHDGAVPEQVWDLLEETLSRATWIPAVVFEILDEYLDRLSPDRIAAQLERARAIWRHHCVLGAALA